MSAHADQNKATLYRVNKNVFIGDKAELWHALGMPPKPSPNAKPRDPKNVAAGQRFRIFREAVLGWPQKASFARHMGWSQQRFGQWENGVHPFPLAELQKVEERFGVRLLDWVYNNDIARLEKHQIDKLNDPRLVPAAGDKD